MGKLYYKLLYNYYMGANWVDLVIIAILLFFLIEGFTNNFIRSALNLAGFLLTYGLALKFYTLAARILLTNFSLPHGIANALGFFAVAIIIEGIYNIASRFLYRAIPQKIITFPLNRYLGFLPALGNGVILVAFILTLVVTLPTNPAVKKDILASKIGSVLVLRTQNIENQINKIFGQAANETLTFLTIHPSPTSQERIDLKFTTREFTVDSVSEQRMLALVNEERVKQGLAVLQMDSKLLELARAFARDMFERGYFSHYNPEGQSPFDRMEKAGIFYTAAGENLAYAPNVEVAHSGLMNSPGHRANILSSDFGKVGIGIIDGGIYGKMFVQEFTD